MEGSGLGLGKFRPDYATGFLGRGNEVMVRISVSVSVSKLSLGAEIQPQLLFPRLTTSPTHAKFLSLFLLLFQD